MPGLSWSRPAPKKLTPEQERESLQQTINELPEDWELTSEEMAAQG
jgi:hypothetical protein